MQNEVQESSRGESHKNGSHKGQYKEGLLEVTLLQVQTADSGQYICAMTCGRVHKAVVMEVIVKDVVNVTVGEDAILPCQLMETHEPSYLKLQWRRISPGKSQTIYSYLYQDTCPVIYSEDRLGDKCSCSNRPHIREQFGEKYKQKAEVFKGNELRNWNCSLKLNNIHKYDAGKYVSSVRFNSLHKVCILNLSVRGNASVIGNVIHEIGQTGQDLILSCKVRGCTPTKLHVQLYKWDSSKNKTLYSYSSTKERHRDQKSSPGDKHDDGIHRGQYKDGVLEVTLLKVQTVDSGQYVCAMTCDHVYSEAIMEVRVEEFHDQNTEILMSYYFVWLYFLYVFLIVLCIFTKIGKCNKENGMFLEYIFLDSIQNWAWQNSFYYPPTTTIFLKSRI
ncbi:uncharacterized protein LOC128330182 [Hemicordylus capensis]|uniref:uncharacterized protein LOC128330182 n=1 Tax=Hemicordylus capensis TaxID=884348 RepID=UPI0023026E1D|nr:uncharacterized protein LOC128330182 [Hemicordylus capensis]